MGQWTKARIQLCGRFVADIDGSRVLWARDLGEGENEKLIRYFPDRHVLLLEPDLSPPQLGPYERR